MAALQNFNFKKASITLGIAGTVLGMASCSNTASKEEKQEEVIENVQATEVEGIVEIENFTEYILPTPIQISYLLKKANLGFVANETTSIDLADNFTTTYSKKLALGIYSGDFAYCALNEKIKESEKYLKVVSELAKEVGLDKIYSSDDAVKRFEANINIPDSIVLILTDIQLESDRYFQNNKVKNDGFIIFAGAWIETLYLASKSALDTKDNNLIARLSEQTVVLDNLIGGLKQAEENVDLVEKLTKLETLFARISNIDEDAEMDAMMLTDNELVKLQAILTEIRSYILNA